jgi:hypothetical protein
MGIRVLFIIIVLVQFLYSEGKTDYDSGFKNLKNSNFNKAVYMFKKSCKSGYGRGCFELAKIYDYAKGIKEDKYKAYTYYKKACKVEDSNGCLYVGIFFENGWVVQKDYKKALENYAFSCDNGNGAGCSRLGILYNSGKGVEQNLEKAKYYLNKGCSLKSGLGCIELARLNVRLEDIDKSYIKAMKIYNQKCNKFYHIACLYLGEFYGRDDTKFYDNNMSKYFLKKACGFGNNDACLFLDKDINFKDNFVIQKIDKLKDISNKEACDLGRADRCYDLAMIYFEAKGVSQNTILAKDYLRRGCYLDNPKACAMLGFIYEYDDKGVKDYKMATRYYKRACMLGVYDCDSLFKSFNKKVF